MISFLLPIFFVVTRKCIGWMLSEMLPFGHRDYIFDFILLIFITMFKWVTFCYPFWTQVQDACLSETLLLWSCFPSRYGLKSTYAKNSSCNLT